MTISKRDFLKAGIAGAGALVLTPSLALLRGKAGGASAPAFEPIAPISVAERKARVARAQALMQRAGVGALLLEPGASMLYFSGINWWRSERLTAVVIPAEGEMGVVTPYFEEPSVRQSLAFSDDVRTWNENENPLKYVHGILRDRGALGKPLAIEATVRYFVVSNLKKLDSSIQTVSGDKITLGCRMYKSDHELALMQRANDITIAAYRATHPQIAAGMSRDDVAAIMARETTRLGGAPEFQLVLVGEASAYPHGSDKPQQVREGEVVLMDCGCTYQGYQSDISRTFVYGEANKKQRQVWDTVHRGQQLGFETAQVGTPAGHVDDVVRAYYQKLGYGPGYKTPGTPHRLGHGIGLEGHERINLVGGETTPIQPRMCFSDEPGIYIYGEFGVRIEDCMHITENGPKWFSTPPPSIDKPFG
ncbi:MAG: Xaa-Pro peptidase family protein [Lysobacterales bacterium]|jgi:Xaa-Pro dipeptidase